jgi:hypothetical protein
MTQIRTAEEILDQDISIDDPEDKEVILYAMQVYAKQFIDLAAEEAKTRTNDESTSVIVDKESILKIKDLIK